MSDTSAEPQLTCSDCAQLNCNRRETRFPTFCLTESVDPGQLENAVDLYRGDGLDARIARAAAEVEGLYYGKLTRVEETVAFARRIGARKIGIASCVGLINETKVFAQVLKLAGLEPFTVACKIGSTDKNEIGIPDELKIRRGGFEAMCNPALQATLMNEEKTDLNVIVGLCAGHDSLFIRHSEAPVTVLIVKDRVLCHNPVAALHTVKSYTSRLLDKAHIDSL
ncbi:DUF1847 domain-containing protein [Azospirillum sp. TSO22-1]|uniref:DUF1847 domain-containing protein n=1 Tax=Azospirillum sp. TSO22-1 TaxID=716789 RepID=UPI000D621E88|nr:DUF1847 domain-containing protein [Azospirillum sp. TSO22-1]PWC40386.1 hypothetical protein TSO221_25395 [Azospirillum sp. TSO22-1]